MITRLTLSLLLSASLPLLAEEPDWKLVTPDAGFQQRDSSGEVVLNGKMWILGGTENYYFGDDSSLKNDVWSSENGRDWMGDDMPSCELNHVSTTGQHFGYPFCHQGDTLDDEFRICGRHGCVCLKSAGH